MKFKFFPEDFEIDAKLLAWTRDQGLTDKMIADQLERIKDHEFNPMRSCPTRTWRRWIRNAIEWGKVVPHKEPTYRQPQQLTDDERKREQAKWEADMRRLKVVK